MLPNYEYPLRVIFAPYNSIDRIRKEISQDFSSNASLMARDFFKQKWADLAQKYCDNQGVNLLMAHYTVLKSSDNFFNDDYDAENMIGGNYTLYPETFPEQVQYVALGHIHSFTEVYNHPCPIVYSSSPLCYSKKENDIQKYVVIIDAEPNQPVQYQKIPLKTGKKIFFYENVTFEQIEEIINKNPDHFYEFTVKVDDTISYLSHKNKLESQFPQIIRITVIKPDTISQENFQEWKQFSEKELFIQYLEKFKNLTLSQEHKQMLEEILNFQNL
ncbi:MAG: hypothetical protein KatS3mg035_0452 [Bacteroidia bacterium]|nr:MAG: hypothetical protein KatS3mg035_0452 [Bacteroidia bacterium]